MPTASLWPSRSARCFTWTKPVANGARTIAVIDIGKTNAKVVLVDRDTDDELAARRQAVATCTDGPYPYMDVERIWDFVCDGLATLNAEHRIGGVTVTTHGAAGAFLSAGDPPGQTGDGLALPVLDYEFNGPDELADEYDALRPDFAECLSPRLPGGLNLGAQIFWQERRFPADVASAATYVTYPQYWTWRLTGFPATDVCSLGCHTDLWAPGKRTWSSLVAKAGWQSLFAPVRHPSDVLGKVRSDIAVRLGLDAVPVACGIHDSNASLLPHLLSRKPPFTVVSTGTWTIVLALGGRLDRLDPARDTLANVTAFGDPVPCARFMGGREFDRLTAGSAAEPDDAAIARVISEQIMRLPPVEAGVGPFPDGPGRWTADPAELTPQERTAAASLYLALMTVECMSLADAAGPTIVEGPFAGNEVYCAGLAALTGRPVVPSFGVSGTGRGAALLFSERRFVRPEHDEPATPLRDPRFDRYARSWRAAVDVPPVRMA